MAQWQMKLNFSEAKARYLSGKCTLAELATATVFEIKNKVPAAKRIDESMGEELENDILPLFEDIVESESEDVDSYDSALESLYDWADTSLDNKFGGKKMCWVEP